MKKFIIILILFSLCSLLFPDSGDDLIQATKDGNLEEVQILIEAGVDINFKCNDYGNSALIWASAYGHLEIVKFLIDSGADVNIQNNYEETALIWANAYGYIEIAELLQEAGATN